MSRSLFNIFLIINVFRDAAGMKESDSVCCIRWHKKYPIWRKKYPDFGDNVKNFLHA